ncbi:hypothetical protein JCM16303_005603 [Sporobolomyces ruberrimus]
MLKTGKGRDWLAVNAEKAANTKEWSRQQTELHQEYLNLLQDARRHGRNSDLKRLDEGARLHNLFSYWERLGTACAELTSLFSADQRDLELYQFIWEFRDDLVQFCSNFGPYRRRATNHEYVMRIIALSRSGRDLLDLFAKIRAIVETGPSQLGPDFDYTDLSRHGWAHAVDRERARLLHAIESVAKKSHILKIDP